MFLTVGIVLIIVLIVILRHLRKTGQLDNDVFRQTIASMVSGALIAFFSFSLAYSLWQIQESKREQKEKQAEEQRIADTRMDSFLQVQNEVSENRLTLGREMKGKVLIRLPLKTEAWQKGKYQLPIETPLLHDSLKLLYDDIEKYNWLVRFFHYKVMQEKLTPDGTPGQVWEALGRIDNNLFTKLKELEKLTTRELVVLKHMSREDYEERFGAWEDNVKIPYFKKQTNNP